MDTNVLNDFKNNLVKEKLLSRSDIELAEEKKFNFSLYKDKKIKASCIASICKFYNNCVPSIISYDIFNKIVDNEYCRFQGLFEQLYDVDISKNISKKIYEGQSLFGALMECKDISNKVKKELVENIIYGTDDFSLLFSDKLAHILEKHCNPDDTFGKRVLQEYKLDSNFVFNPGEDIQEVLNAYVREVLLNNSEEIMAWLNNILTGPKDKAQVSYNFTISSVIDDDVRTVESLGKGYDLFLNEIETNKVTIFLLYDPIAPLGFRITSMFPQLLCAEAKQTGNVLSLQKACNELNKTLDNVIDYNSMEDIFSSPFYKGFVDIYKKLYLKNSSISFIDKKTLIFRPATPTGQAIHAIKFKLDKNNQIRYNVIDLENNGFVDKKVLFPFEEKSVKKCIEILSKYTGDYGSHGATTFGRY